MKAFFFFILVTNCFTALAGPNLYCQINYITKATRGMNGEVQEGYFFTPKELDSYANGYHFKELDKKDGYFFEDDYFKITISHIKHSEEDKKQAEKQGGILPIEGFYVETLKKKMGTSQKLNLYGTISTYHTTETLAQPIKATYNYLSDEQWEDIELDTLDLRCDLV